jgi:hypothetical protein
MKNLMAKYFNFFLSEKSKEKVEEIILFIAIGSFLLHLSLVVLYNSHLLKLSDSISMMFSNPISVIYTPFSFVLFYEFYLLIYYLPKSFTTYIGKQYEIVTLIIIRRLFKDLSNLEISSDWFTLKNDLQFTYDILSTILLFFLIYTFYELAKRNFRDVKINKMNITNSMNNFITFKKLIAMLLVPTLFFMVFYNSMNWLIHISSPETPTKNFNNIFFYDFFTVLILVDVLLLLLSFLHTDKFHKVIRNSGFIISTILLRLSFTSDGLMSSALAIGAVSFGILLLFIHNLYDRSELSYPME